MLRHKVNQETTITTTSRRITLDDDPDDQGQQQQDHQGPIVFHTDQIQQYTLSSGKKLQEEEEENLLTNTTTTTRTTTTSTSNHEHAVAAPHNHNSNCTFIIVMLATIFTMLLSPRSPLHIIDIHNNGSQQQTNVTNTQDLTMSSSSSLSFSNHSIWKIKKLPIFVVGYSMEGHYQLYHYFKCSLSQQNEDISISSSSIQHYCCCGSNLIGYPCNNVTTMGTCLKEKYGNNNNITKDNDDDTCGLLKYNIFTQLESEYQRSYMSLPQDDVLLNDILINDEWFPNGVTLLLNYHDDWPSLVTNGRGIGIRYIHTFNGMNDNNNTMNKKEQLKKIHEDHHERIEKFIKQHHPKHDLIKINVGLSNVGEILQEQIGGKAECWNGI